MAIRLAHLVKEGYHVQLDSKLLTQFMTTIKTCGMYAVPGDPRGVEMYMNIAERVDYAMSNTVKARRGSLLNEAIIPGRQGDSTAGADRTDHFTPRNTSVHGRAQLYNGLATLNSTESASPRGSQRNFYPATYYS
jgi:hypothetical protein